MQRKRSLSVLVGSEVLCHCRRNGLISRDDSLHKTAHGFDTQRKRDHIKQEQIAICVVADQLIGLKCCAKSDDFVWV